MHIDDVSERLDTSIEVDDDESPVDGPEVRVDGFSRTLYEKRHRQKFYLTRSYRKLREPAAVYSTFVNGVEPQFRPVGTALNEIRSAELFSQNRLEVGW